MALPPLTSYNDISSPRSGFGVCCCFPCAYGMLVDMNMYNKVLQDTQIAFFPSSVCEPSSQLYLSSCPSERVAGGGKRALRQSQRVLLGVLRFCCLHPLRHLWQPLLDPKQVQPEGARHLNRVAPRTFRHSCCVLHVLCPRAPSERPRRTAGRTMRRPLRALLLPVLRRVPRVPRAQVQTRRVPRPALIRH